MLFLYLLVIELGFVTSEIIKEVNINNDRRQFDDEWNALTNDILRYIKTQKSKSWWPSWSITPIYGSKTRKDNTSHIRTPVHESHQGPFSEVDSDAEDYKEMLNPSYSRRSRGPIHSLVVFTSPGGVLSSSVPGTATTKASKATTTKSKATTTRTTTTITTTTQLTTTKKSLLAKELNKYIAQKDVGMFSAFLVKFLKIGTRKNPKEMKTFCQALASRIASFMNGGLINRLPDQNMANDVIMYMEQLNLFLTLSTPEDIQHRALLFLKIVEDDREQLFKNEDSIFYIYDKYFDATDAPNLLKVLNDFNDYPGNKISANVMAKEVMDVATLPFERLGGEHMSSMRSATGTFDGNNHIIDKNEAKVLKNDWNYKKDDVNRVFGDIKKLRAEKTKEGVTKKVTNKMMVQKVKVNKEKFKSQRIHRNNILRNNNFISDSLKNRYLNNIVSDVKDNINEGGFQNGSLNEIKRLSKDGTVKRNTSTTKIIKTENRNFNTEINDIRRKFAHTTGYNKEQNRKDKLKKNKNTKDKWYHRLSRQKTSRTKNKNNLNKKVFTSIEDFKIIQSDDLEKQNNLFFKTHIHENTTKPLIIDLKKTNIKDGRKESIQGKLFKALKGKNGRKCFEQTTRSGLQSSSETDEEIQLKMNIYKAIGVNNDFEKVKSK